jgi:hypothetical protein
MKFRAGQKVTVRTVDGGRLPRMVASQRPIRTEEWQGRVVGPSMIGAGWWLVRKAGGRGGITYTVPEREMRRPE